ncbi:MAG: hypothetical protein RL732_1202 [Bacteroidota bacterium]
MKKILSFVGTFLITTSLSKKCKKISPEYSLMWPPRLPLYCVGFFLYSLVQFLTVGLSPLWCDVDIFIS